MPDHGITVIIPENAEGLLCIRIYDSKSIQFPASHRLVSEVFWIESSTYLQKNVELYVPHFVKVRNEEDSKKLSFFMVSDKSYTSSGALEFEASVNSCTFEPGSCYGKVVLGHFCSLCILENVNVDKLPLQHCVTRIFPNNSPSCTHENWEADFVFSYALPTFEKQYPTDEFSLETFPGVTFTQPSATIDFSDEPVVGWFMPGMLRKVRFKLVLHLQICTLCIMGSR